MATGSTPPCIGTPGEEGEDRLGVEAVDVPADQANHHVCNADLHNLGLDRPAPAGSGHSFSLVISGIDMQRRRAFDDAANRLYEAGCDDALFGVSNGKAYVSFSREAATRDEAIASARADVAKAGFGVMRVEEI